MEKIEVQIPKEALLALEYSKAKAGRRMLELLMVDLFKKDRISSGKAAEILGIQKYDFVCLLGEQGESYFRYSSSELEQEFKNVKSWEFSSWPKKKV